MKSGDIEYVLEELGAEGGFKRSGGDNVMVNCLLAPWNHESGEDKTRKMGVLVKDGTALVNCFYPGCFKGTLLQLVQEVGGKKVAAGDMTLEEVSNLKAFILMAEEEALDESDYQVQKKQRPIPQEILGALGRGSSYWAERGMDDDTQDVYQTGELGGRALLPIIDQSGKVVGVQGRLLPGEYKDSYSFDHRSHDEKYRTWPLGFERELYLAGEHVVKHPVDFLVVVESPLDAALLQQWIGKMPPSVLPFDTATNGYAVLATMGGKYSREQLKKVVDFVTAEGEIAVGFDSDHAGRLATRQFVDQVRRFHTNVTEIEWLGNDPSDDEGGKLSLDRVEKRAYEALRHRKNWLELRLKRILDK